MKNLLLLMNAIQIDFYNVKIMHIRKKANVIIEKRVSLSSHILICLDERATFYGIRQQKAMLYYFALTQQIKNKMARI